KARLLRPDSSHPREDPPPPARRSGSVEGSPPEQGATRGRIAQAAAARHRSEPSTCPGPPSEGFRRDPFLPRYGGHRREVLRVVHRCVHVHGSAESVPRRSDGPPLVGRSPASTPP